MDASATGAFVGLTLRHTQAHMTRAVLEGVAYAFRDCLHTLETVGPVPSEFVIGGGGSQGALWTQILASVLGVTLRSVEGAEHTATGAALLAGVGTGVYADLDDAITRAVRYGAITPPDEAARASYDTGYRSKHTGWGKPRWFDGYFVQSLVVWTPPRKWQSELEQAYRMARRRPRRARTTRATASATPKRPKAPSTKTSWTAPGSVEERLRRDRERIDKLIRPPKLDLPGPSLPKIPGMPGSNPTPPEKRE